MIDPPTPAPYPPTDDCARLQTALRGFDGLEFAVLVGSRAQGTAHPASDWDVALCWSSALPPLQRLEWHEQVRQRLAAALSCSAEQIDLIDLAQARLALRAQVAETGLVLHGADTLAWARFLHRTWAELEDFYWRKHHAA